MGKFLTPDHERRYVAMKKLECDLQAIIFALPMKDSPMWKELSFMPNEEWKLDCFIAQAFVLRDKAQKAAQDAFMDGKD
jgi:hypothetical protein